MGIDRSVATFLKYSWPTRIDPLPTDLPYPNFVDINSGFRYTCIIALFSFLASPYALSQMYIDYLCSTIDDYSESFMTIPATMPIMVYL